MVIRVHEDYHEKIVSDEISKLTPVFGKDNASRLLKAYLIGDEKTRKRIMEMVDIVKASILSDKDLKDSILMEPPSQEVSLEGQIEVGNVMYGRKEVYPFFIDKEAFLSHIGIFGSSGYGKTNISYILSRGISGSGIPVIIFDFSKRNYKDLLSTPLKNKTDVFTVGRDTSAFRFNPLKPPEGVQLSQWIKEFASIFDHAYWLLGGGRHIIMKALSELYSKNKNPTMLNLKDWIKNYEPSRMTPRERNWISTAERPLESLCFKEFGEIFECKTGILPSDFFEPGKITILELDALDDNDKTFFIEIMLQWLRDWLIVNNSREELKAVIVLEEAHHVLNREKSRKIGSETVIDLVFREIRELGLGVVYIDQHPSLVSYPALGNTSTQIFMNLGLDTKYSSDIQDACKMLGIDYENDTKNIRELPVGYGLFINRMSRFPRPFVLKFHLMDLKKGSVTDNDIAHHMQLRNPIKQNAMRKTIGSKARIDYEKEIKDLDESDWRIIKAIGNADGAYTSQIYKAARMSGKTFNEKIEKLKSRGYVFNRDARIGRNRVSFYFLTQEGEDLFRTKHDFPKKEKIDRSRIIRLFKSNGWFVTEKDGHALMEKNGKVTNINFVDSNEIDLKRLEEFNFICGSDRTKNMVLQRAARFAYENNEDPIISIATEEGFMKNGKFDRVVFV